MMDVLKVILAILLLPLVALFLVVLLVAHAIASYINDVYGDDIYWGGKE